MLVARYSSISLQHAGAVVLVLHHRGRPGDHREERIGPLGRVVEGPAQHRGADALDQVGESGAHQLPDRRVAALRHARQRAADALGVPGGAAGVEHRTAEALVGRFLGRSCGHELVEVLEAPRRGGTDHERQLDVRALVLLERLRGDIEELVARDQRLRPGIVDDVGEFAGDEVPVDRHERDAARGTRERDLEPLVAVACDHRDRVARSDSRGAEAVDQLVDAAVEFGPRTRRGVVGQREVVARAVAKGAVSTGHVSSRR